MIKYLQFRQVLHVSALTLCIVHCALRISNAQFVYDNAFLIGNTADDAGYSISSDASGNYYCTGNYTYWIDINPGTGTNYLNSNGGLDCYVAKFNSAGALQVAFNIGGSGDDYILSMKTDASGNIYIAGRFEDTVDFAPGATVTNLISNGGVDIFLAKYSGTGVLLWVNAFGGADDDEGRELALDNVNTNVILTGTFESASVDMDPGAGTQNIVNQSTTGFGYTDLFVAGYSASTGAYQWAFRIGGAQGDDGLAVTTDNSGNVFIGGAFSNVNVDFDPGNGTQLLSSAGSVDAYIAKYNGSGAYQWAHRIGNNYGEQCFSLACDNSGNVYAGGYFNSDSCDLDPGAGTNYVQTGGVQDLFVLKLNNSGAYQWAFGLGDFNSEVAQDIAVTGSGDIFICGSFGHTVDFDPGPGTYNLAGNPVQDGYLAQYTTSGNLVDAIPFTGSGYEFGIGLCLIPPNKVGVTGWFSSPTIDFDPGPGVQNLSVTGGNIIWTDAFVATYAYAPAGVNENASTLAFEIYPNPADQSLVISYESLKEEKAGLTIFDLTGRMVFQYEIENSIPTGRQAKSKIDAGRFENGVYFVEISSGNKAGVQKLIIQH